MQSRKHLVSKTAENTREHVVFQFLSSALNRETSRFALLEETVKQISLPIPCLRSDFRRSDGAIVIQESRTVLSAIIAARRLRRCYSNGDVTSPLSPRLLEVALLTATFSARRRQAFPAPWRRLGGDRFIVVRSVVVVKRKQREHRCTFVLMLMYMRQGNLARSDGVVTCLWVK